MNHTCDVDYETLVISGAGEKESITVPRYSLHFETTDVNAFLAVDRLCRQIEGVLPDGEAHFELVESKSKKIDGLAEKIAALGLINKDPEHPAGNAEEESIAKKIYENSKKYFPKDPLDWGPPEKKDCQNGYRCAFCEHALIDHKFGSVMTPDEIKIICDLGCFSEPCDPTQK